MNYGDMFAQEAPRGRYGDQGDLSVGDHGELGPQRNMNALAKLRLKKGDMIMMPERLALALQRDGWYIRSKVIWYKPNPLPGPAQTWRRPINSYEVVLMLNKDWGYYYDAHGVREKPAGYHRNGGTAPYTANTKGINHGIGSNTLHQMSPDGRHLRDVWEIPIKAYPGSHFATYPPDLVEPCIRASTSEKGVCPQCGHPWKRILKKVPVKGKGFRSKKYTNRKPGESNSDGAVGMSHEGDLVRWVTVGWKPTCEHDDDPVPATALDPFMGSGTTGIVARKLGRNCVGLDLSFDYLRDQAQERLGIRALQQWGKGIVDDQVYDDLPIFGGGK